MVVVLKCLKLMTKIGGGIPHSFCSLCTVYLIQFPGGSTRHVGT